LDSKKSGPAEWYWLRSGPGDPGFNMALDEALLETAPERPQPVLRFYSWTEPAASFGYFQQYQDVSRLTHLRPLVRRPTGGGIVPHDIDWTYSLVFPPDHEWYQLTARESYLRVHLWLQTAFAQIGFETLVAPAALKTAAGQCFAGHEESDLLCCGRKIAGAAQRRRRDGLLIQGSVQPPSKGSLDRAAWEGAMLDVGRDVHGAFWKEFQDVNQALPKAADLARTKYSLLSYHQRR
jgi:lipoyl(octanoyl) transferase